MKNGINSDDRRNTRGDADVAHLVENIFQLRNLLAFRYGKTLYKICLHIVTEMIDHVTKLPTCFKKKYSSPWLQEHWSISVIMSISIIKIRCETSRKLNQDLMLRFNTTIIFYTTVQYKMCNIQVWNDPNKTWNANIYRDERNFDINKKKPLKKKKKNNDFHKQWCWVRYCGACCWQSYHQHWPWISAEMTHQRVGERAFTCSCRTTGCYYCCCYCSLTPGYILILPDLPSSSGSTNFPTDLGIPG